MGTRFYFGYYQAPSDGLSAIVSHSSLWSTSITATGGGTALGALMKTPSSAPIQPGSQFTGTVVLPAPPTDVLFSTMVSDPLPAMTLSGTFSLVVQTDVGSNDPVKAYLQVTIRVLSGDGTVVRGTAYAGQSFTTTDAADPDAPNFEYVSGNGWRSRVLRNLPLTSTVVQAGDRIVVEIGTRFTTTGSVLWTFMGFPIGSGLPDMLPIGNRLTNARENAWIEFSQDFFDTSLNVEEYRIGLYGNILNSDATLPFVDITSIDGLDNAPVSVSTQDREGAHGGYVSSEFESIRTVTLEGNIYADPSSLDAYLSKIKKDFAPTARPVNLYFGTDSNDIRLVKACSQGLRYTKTSDRGLGKIPFQVQLVAQDPRIYAEDEVVIGPLAVSTVSPLSTYIDVDGDRETSATIVIVNKATTAQSFSLQLLSSQADVMLLQGVIDPQNVHEIDLDSRTIQRHKPDGIATSPDNVRSIYTLDFGWKYFTSGKNVLIVFAGSTPGTMSVYVKYQAAWR